MTDKHGGVRWLRKLIIIAAGLAILTTVGFIAWNIPINVKSKQPKQLSSPVPVSVAVAKRQNVSVYVSGLGTVQASSTVAVHSQVDGKLQELLFTDGQHIKQGEVLAQIDPILFRAALDGARAKRGQDAALLVAAEKDLARFKTLMQSNAQSQQNVDQQQAKVDQLKASIAADDAAIQTAQTQLDYTTIRAPTDGLIGIRQIDPGNLIRSSDSRPIAVLMRIRPCAVLFTLPSRVLDDVRGSLARDSVEVTAFDQDDRHPLSTGRLLPVGEAVDQATDTIRLKAIFPNDDEKLWPGEFVNARLSLKTLRNALVIPSAAVQRGPQGLFAWIVTSKDTAEPRPIEVGPTTDDLTVITSGLGDGERIVTDGQFKLKRDARVQVRGTSPTSEGIR